MPTQYYEDPFAFQAGKPVNVMYRNRTWGNTPNFWAMRDHTALLPINTYSDDRQHHYQTLGHEVVTRLSDGAVTSDTRIGYATRGDLQSRHNGLSAWVAESEPTDASLENECAIKALGKLADAKVNLPVTVAEAGKTADLILGKANQIFRFLGDIRRGRYGDALHQLGLSESRKFKRLPLSRSSGKLANAWLEYKYGWMPLLMDIKGAAEAVVDRLHGGRLPWVVATATVSSQKARFQHVNDSSYSPGSYWEEAASAAKTYKIKIEADVSTPHLNAAQQLGLTNPALVAWELVPYSFVFDWFVSVGDYLVAATALQGITVRRAFVSRMREVSTSYYSHAQRVISATSDKSGYDFKFGSYGRSYTRQPYVVNPLLLYPPVNRDPLKFQRLLSGLALLRGNARSFRV